MLLITLGPAGEVTRRGTKIVSCTMGDGDLLITTVPAIQAVPLYRRGLGVSMVLDLRSSALDEELEDAGAPPPTLAWLVALSGVERRKEPPPPRPGHRPPLTLVTSEGPSGLVVPKGGLLTPS